jgi:D-alanyl-D-alanine carboxypeptidase (penicillin-binding protein 5/6)
VFRGVVVRTVVLAAAALSAAGSSAPAASPKPKPKQPAITAKAFAAIDADSGRLLAGKRARVRLPIASLTKVMTGLVVIERGNLETKVRVPALVTRVEPTNEGLVPGKRYKRSTLLWSALLASANDSATALAWDAGGGSLEGFYALMNARARALGMRNTTYASASGLDDRVNRSTAFDQAILARAALRNPTFAAIVATRRKLVRWAAPTHAKEWINHNKMLATYPGTYGVKTGWTTRAGGCLAVAVRRGDRAVVAVVLRSSAIWSDMPLLVERAFKRLDAR